MYWNKKSVAAVAAGTGNKDEYAFGVDLALNPVKDMVALTAGAWYDLKAKLAVMTGKLSLTAGDFSAYDPTPLTTRRSSSTPRPT